MDYSNISIEDLIIMTIARTRITRYPVVACYTVLLYEFFLVLDQEYRLIYKSRCSLLKFLYLACRFFPLLIWPAVMYSFMNDHTYEECKPLVVFGTLAFVPLLALPRFLYVFRVWSITGRRVSLAWFFVICLVGYMVILLWSTADDLSVAPQAFTNLSKTGCYRPLYKGYSPFVRGILAALALDFVVGAILVTYYHFTLRRSHGRLGRLVFNQDMLFFPLVLLLDIFTVVILTRPLRYLDRCALVAGIVITNIMACRFILQIRELSWPTEVTELHEISRQVRKDLRHAQTTPNKTGEDPTSPARTNCAY